MATRHEMNPVICGGGVRMCRGGRDATLFLASVYVKKANQCCYPMI